MALMGKGKSVVSTPSPRKYFQSRVPTVQSPNRPIASMETSLVEDQRIALEDKHNACAASTAMGPQSQVTEGSVKRAKAKAINNLCAKPHTTQKKRLEMEAAANEKATDAENRATQPVQ